MCKKFVCGRVTLVTKSREAAGYDRASLWSEQSSGSVDIKKFTTYARRHFERNNAKKLGHKYLPRRNKQEPRQSQQSNPSV
mmetsp:Transcript_16153/g.29388  ORF Transcript_16153/g.29388 Transcript_16153/m.29388 type:complete len:81 (-) Transcript_16153:1003-1245(-)